MQWFYRLLATRDDWAITAARVLCGAMMFSHGAQKMLGLWGGDGFSATMSKMSHMLPAPIVFLVIMFEFFGAVFLFFGLLSRPAALAVIIVMLGAILKVHLPNGFYAPKGFEIPALYFALALVPLIGGSGALSLDRLILRGRGRRKLAH